MTKKKTAASQETAIKPAKKVAAFVSVEGNDPVFVNVGKISKSTALLSFKDADGKVYKGYCQEHTTDLHSHSAKAKKGDRVWFTRDNVTIPNVIAFKQ